MIELTFPVSPVAASRPRVGRFSSYYTGAYQQFREQGSKIVDKILGNLQPFEGPLIVEIRCFCTRPKTTKLTHPRSDIDNLAKGILDLLNKKLWLDDSQIVGLFITKNWVDYPNQEGYFTIHLEHE